MSDPYHCWACIVFLCHFYDVFVSFYITVVFILAMYLQTEPKMVCLMTCLRRFLIWNSRYEGDRFFFASFVCGIFLQLIRHGLDLLPMCNIFGKVIQGMFDCLLRVVTEPLPLYKELTFHFRKYPCRLQT